MIPQQTANYEWGKVPGKQCAPPHPGLSFEVILWHRSGLELTRNESPYLLSSNIPKNPSLIVQRILCTVHVFCHTRPDQIPMNKRPQHHYSLESFLRRTAIELMANLGILLVEAGLGGQQKGVLGGKRVHGIVGGLGYCLAQSKACNSEKYLVVACGCQWNPGRVSFNSR